MLHDSSGRKKTTLPTVIVKVSARVSVRLKYACVYIESVIHSLPQVSQAAQRDRVT